MHKKNIALVLAAVGMVGTLCVPLLASAQTAQTSTIGGLEAQIASLLSQLTVLRGELGQAVASSTSFSSSTPWNASGTAGNPGGPIMPVMPGMPGMGEGSSTHPLCVALSRNLSVGSEGSDVSVLQAFLAQQPGVYPSGTVSGYFGPLTQNAVIRFQEMNGIASSSTGFVGPLTRNFFKNRCGGGPGPAMPPMMPFDGSGTHPMLMGSSTFSPPPMFMNGSSSAPSGTPPMPVPPPPSY